MADLRAPWVRYLVVGVALAVVDMALPDGLAQSVLYGVAAGIATGMIVVGTHLHRPAQAGAWYLLAAGMASWVIGSTLHMWRVPGEAISTSDVFFLAAYPIVATAMTLFARSRGPGRRPTALIDSAVLTLGVGMLSWVFLVEPAWRSDTGGTIERLVAAAYPLGNVVLLGSLLWLAKAPGAARSVWRFVAAATATMLAVQSVAQATTGAVAPDVRSTLIEPVWLLGFTLAGAAALHPSMRAISEPGPPRPEAAHVSQVLGLAAAVLVGPAILGWQLVVGAVPSVGPVILAGSALMVLVMVRMLRMVRHEEQQAATDDLTGLPNRRALYRQGAERLAGSRRPMALLMLDLDGFKEVNDSLGHQAGDELLVQVGERLRAAIGSRDLLVRLGGDEFAILLEDTDLAAALLVARRLGACLDEPFEVDGMSVPTTVSIGIALAPEHGTDLGTLLRKADIAMYRSKADGPPQAYAGTQDDGAARLRLVAELRKALAGDEMLLHHQPKVDLATGRVRGVEALVRWQHPTRGLLAPADFLDVVEESGLMRSLTRTVLSLALDQAVRWRADGLELTVAVNLSASSLVDVELPDEVATMLAERDLPAGALQLEITEEFLMADRERARAILTRLRDGGVQIAVDDFGTGYSSLSYLRDLPIDELKLDRSFVQPMSDDTRAAALVASTIALAHSLELRMVAEGVEDGEALHELTRLGCDEAQGYFLSRALPAAELADWLGARAASPTRVPTPRHP